MVRKEDRHLESALNIGVIVRYNKKGWTHRPKDCGPLAVFKTVEDARQGFVFSVNDLTIFKCEIKKSKDKTLWTLYMQWRDTMHPYDLPEGTMLADKVKLLEEVI